MCDYGKPSGHSLTSTGLLLLIIWDLKITYDPPKRFIDLLRIGAFITVLFVMFSRVWYGQHSVA